MKGKDDKKIRNLNFKKALKDMYELNKMRDAKPLWMQGQLYAIVKNIENNIHADIDQIFIKHINETRQAFQPGQAIPRFSSSTWEQNEFLTQPVKHKEVTMPLLWHIVSGNISSEKYDIMQVATPLLERLEGVKTFPFAWNKSLYAQDTEKKTAVLKKPESISLIHGAIAGGNLEVIKHIINKAAEYHPNLELINHDYGTGITPLDLALQKARQHGDHQVIDYLANKGADITEAIQKIDIAKLSFKEKNALLKAATQSECIPHSLVSNLLLAGADPTTLGESIITSDQKQKIINAYTKLEADFAKSFKEALTEIKEGKDIRSALKDAGFSEHNNTFVQQLETERSTFRTNSIQLNWIEQIKSWFLGEEYVKDSKFAGDKGLQRQWDQALEQVINTIIKSEEFITLAIDATIVGKDSGRNL